MSQYLYYDQNDVIRIVSSSPIITNIYKSLKLDSNFGLDIVGKKLCVTKNKKLKLALVCNWNDQCGISTYTQFLINELRPLVGELKIFSEDRGVYEASDFDVDYCWKRGTSMIPMTKKVLSWSPDIILIQHEFGLFPKANYFLPMLEAFNKIPTVVTLHSVYEHLDKSICTAAMPNIIVHSEIGKDCLRNKLGHKHQNIFVIPHGCVQLDNVSENWNFFGVPHPILQFGFGFEYKGVDIALEAIHILKNRSEKFKDIFYCYLCSQSNHAKNIHNEYYKKLKAKVEALDLVDNVTIQRGFFSDAELNQYLRTARLAIFPYVTVPNNVVYGASGAARIAMANKTPVIASKSHMFADLEGVVPRPGNALELANEIEKVFTDKKYKSALLSKQERYVLDHSWAATAEKYYKALWSVVYGNADDKIVINEKDVL